MTESAFIDSSGMPACYGRGYLLLLGILACARERERERERPNNPASACYIISSWVQLLYFFTKFYVILFNFDLRTPDHHRIRSNGSSYLKAFSVSDIRVAGLQE